MSDDKEMTPTAKTQIGADILIQAIRRTDTEKPTKADREKLDGILRDYPQLWQITGDVIEITAQKLMKDIHGTYAVRKSLQTGWKQLQVDLARPDDGALEKLLIQQVALCWLKLAYTEHQHEHFLTHSERITVSDFWERRLSAAQRRYLRAIETLARIRRLQLPTVQVNIGAQQVNQVK